MERQERWGQAPLDRTEPRLEAELREADNVMAAETRSTGYYYNRDNVSNGQTLRPGEKATMPPRQRSSRHTLTWRRDTTIT
jgi:hypothetical protein